MIAGMPDHSKRIAEIRDLLASGVSSTTVDGVATSFDLESLRAELRRLEAEDTSRTNTRPRLASINLSGFTP